MATLEHRLRSLRQIRSSKNFKAKQSIRSVPERSWLSEPNKNPNAFWAGGMIEDDHIPFMERGVEILHIIPTPFPWVWHREEDDGEHLDIPTVIDWAQIVTGFAAEWMDLENYMPKSIKERHLLERSERFLEEDFTNDHGNIKERDEL